MATSRSTGRPTRRSGSAPSRVRNAAIGAVAAVAIITAIVVTHPARRPPHRAAAARLVLGVLEADPSFLRADTAAGIRLATLNLDWARAEPVDGDLDAAYLRGVAAAAADYRHAGWRVAVDPGLQQPPTWALDLTGGRLVDQHGVDAAAADFEFSAAVRLAAGPYLTDVVRALGPVEYYRVGLSENGEMHYPDTDDDQWWAFSGPAQGTTTGLPAGVGITPLPGWVPGGPLWRGHRVTATQVTGWYDWYFRAMVDAHAWEMAVYRAAGYRGELELVIPGTGALPDTYRARLADRLAPDPAIDAYDTVNSGAVWWRLLDDLPSLSGTTLDVSSVGDRSGSPGKDDCTPVDNRVDYRTDAAVDGWSDTRWLTYLAGRHHLPVIGENPGNTPAADLPGIFRMAESCHLRALQWAWDYQLHDGGPATSLAELHRAYAAVPPTGMLKRPGRRANASGVEMST